MHGQVLFQEPLHSETPHRTLLTVVVHDHDSDGDQLKTKEAILADLHSIWASVPKVSYHQVIGGSDLI